MSVKQTRFEENADTISHHNNSASAGQWELKYLQTRLEFWRMILKSHGYKWIHLNARSTSIFSPVFCTKQTGWTDSCTGTADGAEIQPVSLSLSPPSVKHRNSVKPLMKCLSPMFKCSINRERSVRCKAAASLQKCPCCAVSLSFPSVFFFVLFSSSSVLPPPVLLLQFCSLVRYSVFCSHVSSSFFYFLFFLLSLREFVRC